MRQRRQSAGAPVVSLTNLPADELAIMVTADDDFFFGTIVVYECVENFSRVRAWVWWGVGSGEEEKAEREW